MIQRQVQPLDIAVIGSGISGLSAAWLLSKAHRVTLFERETRIGGHSNTCDAPGHLFGQMPVEVPVDTGFIVYNTASYPNLIALFEHLDVPTARSDMGFAVSLDDGAYEYSGSGVPGLFGQYSNLLRPRHYRMIADMLRFFREAPKVLAGEGANDLTLGGYLAANRYSQDFIDRHILPMAAAIWSTPSQEVLSFPAAAFVRFFDNHGLLRVNGRPAWRTVRGGSREYVRRLLGDMAGRVEAGAPVLSVSRSGRGVHVTHAKGSQDFDACVVAAHADEALAMLGDADADERRLLGAFRYKPNRAVLHTDAGLMPKRRRVWSSWNYLASGAGLHRELSLTYWMNNLQPLGGARDLFVTLNPQRPLAPGAEIAAFDYSHPLFDSAAMSAQKELWSLQGRRRTWFCGSYFGYGFHEDGLQSGLAAAEDIGGARRPWSVADESGRIHLGPAGARRVRPPAEAAE